MTPTTSQDPAPSSIIDYFKSTTFTSHVEDLTKKWHIPGFSIAIIQDQEITSAGFGFATLEPLVPCTADTLFDIASSSKSLTAASVGLLVQDDMKHPDVQWHSKMSKLLPEDFVMSEESYTEDVTVEDILSHRSGLPSHDDTYFGNRSSQPDTSKGVTRNLRNLPISAPIRSKYQYCNQLYTVATHLVETLTNTTFSSYLQTSFFQPLNMHDTYLQPSAVYVAGKRHRLALPYTWNQDRQSFTPILVQETPESQGAGSIQTSVNDYIKWVKAFLHQEHPITPELYRDLTRVRIIQDPESADEDRDPFRSFTGYAAGLEVFYYRGHQIIGHDGLITGYASRHFWMPEFGFGAVLFGNSNGAEQVTEILAMQLVDEVLGVPENERLDWNSRAHEKSEQLEKDEQPLAKKLRPDLAEPEVLTTPLSKYAGQYWNTGYRDLEVEIKDEELFVDATDRSMGFWLIFEHVAEQKVFVAKLTDYFDKETEELEAEFKFEGDEIVSLGIKFEEELEDYIWFDKMS